MVGMVHDVFISYSSKDNEVAQVICHTLEQNDIMCWMAPRDITPGRDYGDMIDEAILGCRVFLFVFSSKSVKSVWCRGELNVAFSENKNIIPYRIDTTPMVGAVRIMLNQFHWLDAYPDYKSQLSQLVQTINNAFGRVGVKSIQNKRNEVIIANDNRDDIHPGAKELASIINAIELTKRTFTSIIKIEKYAQISSIGIVVIGKVVLGKFYWHSKFLLSSSEGTFEYVKKLNFNNISEMPMYSQAAYNVFNKLSPRSLIDFYLDLFSMNGDKVGDSIKANRGDYVGLMFYNRSDNKIKYLVENSSHIYCI